MSTRIELANGDAVVLVQEPCLDNDWSAAGYLASEDQDDETGPTVKVTWASLGADESEDDADWSHPDSIVHFRLGDLAKA